MKNAKYILIILFVSLFYNSLASDNDIFSAVKSAKYNQVDSILKINAKAINAIDETNKTPLFWAVIKNQPKILKLLIEYKSDVAANEVSGNVPLYYAARYGYYECAKILIEYGANADELMRGRTTPLMIACGLEGNGGSVDVVKLLIENGANVNGVNNSCWPLRMATRKGFTDIVDYLLENNASLPENEAQLKELLKNSVKAGAENLFIKLVNTGISLELNTENGANLLHEASNSVAGTDEIIQSLIDKGFELNVADNYGCYPIHYAADKDNLCIVKTLIKNGANVNVRTIEGKTAYNIAKENENQDIINYLKEKNAITDKPVFPVFKGQYFGQEMNDSLSQNFLPGIVNRNRNAHAVIVFSPDGKEAYWKLDGRILCSKLENNKWTLPYYPSFSPEGVWCDVPFVSPDNNKIFFNSRKPISKEESDIKENIWYAERTESGWSEPEPLPEVVNKSQLHWQTSVDLKGNIYFGARRSDSKGGADIYCSKFENGAYQEPVNVGDSINTGSSETCPYISPNGDYIIYTRIDRNASPRVSLYINYLLPDGKWSKSINLSEHIPFRSHGLGNYVTHDEKYIFYLDGYAGNNTVYWYKADFIKELNPNI